VTSENDGAQPRAVIFIPNAGATASADRCMNYIDNRQYGFAGLVAGDWDAVLQMFDDEEAHIAVADRREDPPPNRMPRVEYVADQAPTQARPDLYRVHRRRTMRVIRPDAEA
jgi:hypothetical protein